MANEALIQRCMMRVDVCRAQLDTEADIVSAMI